MKIYAPVRDFNGLRNNVRFVNGVGETDNQLVIQWFKNHGYIIEKSLEKCDEPIEKSLEKCDFNLVMDAPNEQIEPDFDEMTPNELREWAKANGLGGVIKNTRSKEKLLELIRG